MSQKAKGVEWLSGVKGQAMRAAHVEAFCRSSPASEWTEAWRVSVDVMPHLHLPTLLFFFGFFFFQDIPGKPLDPSGRMNSIP